MGLDPKIGFKSIQNLKEVLLNYANQKLGLLEDESLLDSEPKSPYFLALADVHSAQQKLLQAQRRLVTATENNGNSLEFNRMYDAITQALMNFPAS